MTSGLGLYQPVPSRVGTRSQLAQGLRPEVGADGASFMQFLRDASDRPLEEARTERPTRDDPARGGSDDGEETSAAKDRDESRIDDRVASEEDEHDRGDSDATESDSANAAADDGARTEQSDHSHTDDADPSLAVDDALSGQPGESGGSAPGIGVDGSAETPIVTEVEGEQAPTDQAEADPADDGAIAEVPDVVVSRDAEGTPIEPVGERQVSDSEVVPTGTDEHGQVAGGSASVHAQGAGIAVDAPEQTLPHAPDGGIAQAPKGVTAEKFAKTRFNDSIRVQVREAARVDLDEIAAEELRAPTERARASRASVDRASVPAPQSQGDDEAPRAKFAERTFQFRPAPTDAPKAPQAEAKPASAARPTPISANVGAPASSDQNSPGAGGDGKPGFQGGSFVRASVAAVPAPATGIGNAPGARASSQTSSIVGDAKGVSKASEAARAGPKAPALQTKPEPGETAKRVLAQVSRGFASVLRHKGGSLTLRLTPQSLGEIKIKVRVQGGSVQASFRSSGGEARELLRDNLSSLKESLERTGVRVERLHVEDSPRDAARFAAETRTPGDGSPDQQGSLDAGDDGRSPGGDRHGGRSGGDGGDRPLGSISDRRDRGGGVDGVSDEHDDDRLVGVGGGLGLDTFA